MYSFVLIGNNSAKRNELAEHSITVQCISDGFTISSLKNYRDTVYIVDFDSTDVIVQYESLLKEIVNDNLPCIGICSESHSVKKMILQSGIMAVFGPSQYKYIPLFFKEYKPAVTGTIAIIDTDVHNTYGLSTVIQIFGYNAVVLGTLDAFCDIQHSIDMVCINCSQVSTHDIATKYVAGRLPKKNALVLYKIDERDVFIHDIIKLHRIARVIYTLEEVYILLVQLLFRQQFHSLLHSVYEASDMQRSVSAYRGNLRQLYLEAGVEIFALPSITHIESIDSLSDKTEMLKTILGKAAGFSWLSDTV